MNSRQKRKYRSYGLDTKEKIAEYLAKKAEDVPKFHQVHCSHNDYHKTDEHHKMILNQARAVGLGGKHIGSKPLGKITARLRSFEHVVARFATAAKAMQRIEERQNGENN